MEFILFKWFTVKLIEVALYFVYFKLPPVVVIIGVSLSEAAQYFFTFQISIFQHI